LLQLVVLVVVIGPLQRWRPVEAVTDRATVRVDMLYTAIHRLGLFRVVLFFTVTPWFDALFGTLRVAGWETFHLDAMWPGVTDQPVVSLLIYLLAIDFCNYWMHRGQHQFEWWWRLHSLHHSQRQMTMWSDNRNHLLDDVIRDSLMVVVAQLIGIAPGQFVAIVAFTQLSENFQHANLRLWFGRVGERLWVSPRFHRLHHSVGIGHESAGSQTLGGANFGVLLPWWDMLFGTANFEQRFDPTGVRDQVEQGRDYGRGFWSQQWLGLKRLAGKV
jgi:sterol desaturase/sphingolipid hydroxylase (fatty acid hydroxylase superfamily)